MKKIQVIEKGVYGKTIYYPSNDVATKFLKLTGTKTFTVEQLSVIACLGFELEVIHPVSQSLLNTINKF